MILTQLPHKDTSVK